MNKNTDSINTRKKLEDYSFSLNHNIGKGYSSCVYRGCNDITNQIVAIKVIDMRMLKGEVHKNLLNSQIQVLRSLKNARNIIQVFDIYTTKNNTYIITEFCQGGDLSKVIASRRGLPQKQALQYLREIVYGYGEINSNRIIHRDLKPANILLKNNRIKIADFGFAMRSSDSKKLSSYNVGSPIYMPPEALNENKYSFKSDIWAIGIIYYQLLTGRTPWKAKTQKQLGKQLLLVPISKLLPSDISQASAQFLQRALCVNFDRRMGADQLESFMQRFDGVIGGGSLKCAKTAHSLMVSSSGVGGTQCSIKGGCQEEEGQRRVETSLNKNTINTPKNMRRFTLFKGNRNTGWQNGTVEEIKASSLPKTASTINRTQTTSESDTHNKHRSKQLLSQIHFCRFVYKLLQRIQNKINGDVSLTLRQYMWGVILNRFTEIKELKCLKNGIDEYRKSCDFRKICQIVNQYEQKYRKQLNEIHGKWNGFDTFERELSMQIKSMYQEIKKEKIDMVQQKVIILDYLITLRQLSNLLGKNDIEMFHEKSKIEAIVEGAPVKVITEDHLKAISSKLKAIKLI